MELLAVLVIILVLVGVFAAGRSQRAEVGQLQRDVAALKKDVASLRSDLNLQPQRTSEAVPPKQTPAAAAPPAAQRSTPPRQTPAPPQTSVPPLKPQATRPVAKPFDFEKEIGGRLPVWIGGIALALAGIFLVKYSIDEGWISPPVRCVLGAVFGMALLGAAQWMRSRPAIANGERIAQALSGAGIAALYGTFFAATSLYELVAPAVGFAGMAVVTATAVLLSLRHGAPIAVLGLIGGFLTPALISSREPNAPVLFTYLFALTSGLFLLIRHRNWWWLAWPTIGAAFLWLGVWIVFFGAPGDSIWLSFFVLASLAIVVTTTTQGVVLPYEGKDHAMQAPGVFGMIVFAIAVLFLAAITVRSDFDVSELVLYGILAAGSIALAAYDERYRMAPWMALAVSIVMLAIWETAWTEGFAVTLVAFATLFVFSGYVLMWLGRTAVSWAALSAASALLFYLLAYARLREFTEAWDVIAAGAHTTAFPVWGAIAMALAVLATIATGRVMEKFARPDEAKQVLLAIFAVSATSFLSLGLGIELEREFLSVAIAAQLLMIAWLDTRVEIKALRQIAAVLAAVFALLLAPQILLLIELTGYAIAETRVHAIDALPVVQWPLFQLGLPALMFAGASVLLRRRRDDALVRVCEGAAIALIGVMGYYLIRYVFYSGSDVLFSPGTFFERGIITNALFAYALALLWVARRFARSAVQWGGVIVGGTAAFRILFFDILISNPLNVSHDVGAWPLLNYLLLPFGLPILWLWLANRATPQVGGRDTAPFAGALSLILAFVLVSLNVRQIYQGPVIDMRDTSDAEIYTYSFVWLLGGVGLLFAGTLRKDKVLRYASLALMVLTVAKVFLYDASALTGLLRVVSFFGLGLSLLGLSWFYMRFVFAPAAQAEGQG